MSGHFTKIENAGVVLCNRGVYKSCDLYTTCDGERDAYAKVGTGFIKLRPRGNTSTSAKWSALVGVTATESGLKLTIVSGILRAVS